MDQNNGPEANVSKDGTRSTIEMDLQEIFPHLTRIALQGQTSHMRITIRTMEDHMISAQISFPIEAMKIGPEIDLSLFKMGHGETTETFSFSIDFKERILTKHFLPPTMK